MIVLAHRGNLEGPDPQRENSLSTVAAAFSCGFGVETDLRFSQDGTAYISHDALGGETGQPADQHAATWAKYPERLVALNIKERRCERLVLSLLHRFERTKNTVLFDMELIEPTIGEMATEFQRLDPACEIAARVSDRGETIGRALALPGTYIWLDEMDSEWAQQTDIARLKEARRTILAVSRDLHRAPPEDCVSRWRQFAEWGVDAICTDWPKRAAHELRLSTT